MTAEAGLPRSRQRIEGPRLQRLLRFAAASFALLLVLVFIGYAQQRLSFAQQARYAAQVQQQQAQLDRQQAQLQAQTVQVARQLLADAERLGLDPSVWAERRTNLRQAQVPREAAAELVGNSSRHPGRLFGAEEFELSVTRSDEGLFNPPGYQAAPLLMTLRGLALIRTQESP